MGGGRSLTQGVEWKQILFFTLPIMAGQFLQQLYNAVDGLIVGNVNGETALAAVGTCAPVTMLFVAIALGMSTGCSVMISQYYGAKRMEELRRGVSTSLILLIGLGLVLTIVGGAVAKWLLGSVLAVEEGEMLEAATAYFTIYCLGLTFQFAYNIVAAVLRSLGDSMATLIILLVSSVANIGLDLLFVWGFGWGVPGAAWATIIAQALSAVVSFIYMFRRYELLRFSRREFRYHRDMGRTALRLAVPTTLQQCVISCGHIAVQRVVNKFYITAAIAAASRVENFILIPIFSLNAGLATFSGQNLGAGKPERVRRGLHGGWVMGAVTSAALGTVVFFFGGQLSQLFGLEGASVAIAQRYLRFMGPCFEIFSLMILTSGVLQGAGDVLYTAFATIANLLLRVALTYALAYGTGLGMAAIWVSMPIGWLFALGLTLGRYKWGPWHKKAIVREESL